MSSQSRIRVFAGPNGSGKTSLYSVVSKTYNSGIFINADEIEIWQWLGLSYRHAIWAGQCSGIIEIIFGLLFIFMPTKLLHGLSIFGLFSLFVLVAIVMPDSLVQAFNPVIMNVAMISLSLIYLKITLNPQ